MPEPEQDPDKVKLISLPEAAAIYGFNRRYLGALARRGRLKAQKIGGVWVTTPKDVETFIHTRERKGAFRNDIRAG